MTFRSPFPILALLERDAGEAGKPKTPGSGELVAYVAVVKDELLTLTLTLTLA